METSEKSVEQDPDIEETMQGVEDSVETEPFMNGSIYDTHGGNMTDVGEDEVEIVVCSVVPDMVTKDTERDCFLDSPLEPYICKINGKEYIFCVNLEPYHKLSCDKKSDTMLSTWHLGDAQKPDLRSANTLSDTCRKFRIYNDDCKRECYKTRWRKRNPYKHQWEMTYECNVCGEKLKSDFALTMHMKTHCSALFHCGFCDTNLILDNASEIDSVTNYLSLPSDNNIISSEQRDDKEELLTDRKRKCAIKTALSENRHTEDAKEYVSFIIGDGQKHDVACKETGWSSEEDRRICLTQEQYTHNQLVPTEQCNQSTQTEQCNQSIRTEPRNQSTQTYQYQSTQPEQCNQSTHSEQSNQSTQTYQYQSTKREQCSQTAKTEQYNQSTCTEENIRQLPNDFMDQGMPGKTFLSASYTAQSNQNFTADPIMGTLEDKKSSSSVPPYTCEICHSVYRLSKSLTRHYLVHNALKPYACDLCGKRFSLKSYLTAHIKTHFRQEPVSCKACLKQFTRRGNLKVHMYLHSGERCYRCQLCGKTFNYISNLRRHNLFVKH